MAGSDDAVSSDMARSDTAPSDTAPSEAAPSEAAPFDPSRAYEKHPQVAIRRESFGALAYHYGNRRLVFLKTPALADVVETLGDYPSAADALAASVPAAGRGPYGRALSGLLASNVIRPR
jgi:putative mycofactocin binding protein MftB